MAYFWVFIGGGLGSSLRYLLGNLLSKSSLSLPIATLTANLISCLVFAISVSFYNEKLQQTPSLKLFLLTGICGGLSTFSTFSFETYELLKQGQVLWASSNILISVLLCLVIFFTFIGK